MTHTGGYGDVVTNTAWYGYDGDGWATRRRSRSSTAIRVVSTDPADQCGGRDPATDITATFDADVDASTVTTRTFVAQGMMGGLLEGTYDTTGDTVTFDPRAATCSPARWCAPV